MSVDADFVVIGGGLAGSCIALNLLKKGKSVHLIHRNELSGDCASLVPLGLFNPAAAMQARKSLFAEEALVALKTLLHEISLTSDKTLFSETGIIRPCLNDQLLKNFKRSFTEENWPGGWVDWIDGDEMLARFPGLAPVPAGLFVKTGLTVDTPALLHSLHEMINTHPNGTVYADSVSDAIEESGMWKLTTGQNSTINANGVIFACAAGLKQFSIWNYLRLHHVKGETLSFEFENQPFESSVAGKGYIAFHKGKMVVGSTYDHHFEHLQSTEKGKQQLLQKLGNMFPNNDFVDESGAKAWAGIRISTPDRLPIIGKHPNVPNCYITTGFGSKGLMYSSLTAGWLADFIVNNAALPAAFDVNRFS